jgi:hypothetical protein
MFVLYSSETLVNTQIDSDQLDSAIAVAPDNRSVVVWMHYATNTQTDILAQRFDANGNRAGAEIKVATTSRNESSPDVTISRSGDFTVTWTETSSFGNSDIKARRFSSTGVPRGNAMTVAATSDRESTPSIAAASNGDFVITWTRERQATGQGSDVQARMYRSSGAAIGPVMNVAASTSLNESRPDVTRAADGQFAISYMTRVGNSSESSISLNRYSKTGTLLGVHAITTDPSRMPSAQRCAMDDQGTTVVVWDELVGMDRDIKARRAFSSGGLSGIVTIAQSLDQELLPDVAVASDGSRYAVTYYNAAKKSAYIVELTAIGGIDRVDRVSDNLTPGSIPVGVSSNLSYGVSFTRNSGSTGKNIYRRRGTLLQL